MQQAETKVAPPKAGGEKMGLIQWAASRFGEVEAGKVMGILRATCFRVGATDEAATDAEVAALLIVARNYDLNPFTKEIFAFKDKHKGIVPIVSIDGWVRLVNGDPAMDGVEFETGEEIDCPHGGKKAFKWVKCRMYVKGRTRPVEVTEYFDEVYQEPRGVNKTHGPWQTHPKRMHRHKAYIQCGRVAFGFGGIYDEDEGERIIGAGIVIPPEPEGPKAREGEHVPASRASTLAAELANKRDGAQDAEIVDEGNWTVSDATGVLLLKVPEGALIPGALTTNGEWISPEGQIYIVKSIDQAKKAVVVEPRPVVKAVPPAKLETPEQIEAALKDLKIEDSPALLGAIMALPDGDGRKALSDKWTAKVQELSGTKPQPKKGKPAGSAQQLDKLVDEMAAAKDAEALDIVSDKCREYTWTPNQRKKLDEKYAECAAKLRPA